MASYGWNYRLEEHLVDFSDTAHVVKQLDLVICIDTAVAHLAGALNRPTWLLLPYNADFRWLRDRTIHPGTHLCVSSGRLLAMIGHQLLSNSILLSMSCFSSMWHPLPLPKV